MFSSKFKRPNLNIFAAYIVSGDAVYCIDCAVYFLYGETKALWFFCQQGIKLLP